MFIYGYVVRILRVMCICTHAAAAATEIGDKNAHVICDFVEFRNPLGAKGSRTSLTFPHFHNPVYEEKPFHIGSMFARS